MKRQIAHNPLRILVTGATGFLGGALCTRLLDDEGGLGSPLEITACGRNREVGSALTDLGVQFVAADLADKKSIMELCKNQDYVFHAAALSSPWGKYQDFYSANVVGTENIIAGCRQTGLERLIYVSTPSLYFTGRDQFDILENVPLPKPFNHYIKTKRIAEERIDQAFSEGLPVITIRPRALFGPGDRAIFPRLLKALADQRLPIIGSGDNIVDLTYIDNVVESLLCAAKASDEHLGKKYNITNDEQVELWPLIVAIAEILELPPPNRKIPAWVARVVATILEMIHKTIRRNSEPRLTRYSVGVLSCSTTLDISAAKRDLHYQPIVSVEEGMQRFVNWYRQQN